MRLIHFFLVFILLTACSVKTGVVRKTDEGVEFDMKKTGKMSYKDGDVEVEIDTRQPSVLEDLIKIWGIRMLDSNKR